MALRRLRLLALALGAAELHALVLNADAGVGAALAHVDVEVHPAGGFLGAAHRGVLGEGKAERLAGGRLLVGLPDLVRGEGEGGAGDADRDSDGQPTVGELGPGASGFARG
jgi:hypothetical protein